MGKLLALILTITQLYDKTPVFEHQKNPMSYRLSDKILILDILYSFLIFIKLTFLFCFFFSAQILWSVIIKSLF